MPNLRQRVGRSIADAEARLVALTETLALLWRDPDVRPARPLRS